MAFQTWWLRKAARIQATAMKGTRANCIKNARSRPRSSVGAAGAGMVSVGAVVGSVVMRAEPHLGATKVVPAHRDRRVVGGSLPGTSAGRARGVRARRQLPTEVFKAAFA